ncbi:MAG: hypothetical protein AAF696_13015 [Bacteroidota bacterium]
MKLSLKAILRVLYSLRKWPYKFILLGSVPLLCASLVFIFLNQRPSGYISSAILELNLQKKYSVVSQQDSLEPDPYFLQAELAQQMARQIKTSRLMFILGCQLSSWDLKSQALQKRFRKEIGISSKLLFEHLLSSLMQQDLVQLDRPKGPEMDSLIHLSLEILKNDAKALDSKIHLQWIPGSSRVRLKVYDAKQERAEFITNHLSQLAIRYQKEIGLRLAEAGIEAQKLLINERRDSWEASKEFLKLERQELHSGRGPQLMREISRKIFALKRSMVETEEKIQRLKKSIREKREQEQKSPMIISVRNDPEHQESLILELSKALNRLRLINTELKSLQDKLRKYEEKHLQKFWEKEKGSRKALLEAQEHLKVVMSESTANLVEISLVEEAKTNIPATTSIWILSTFSFLASLALWLIFLQRIRYFR